MAAAGLPSVGQLILFSLHGCWPCEAPRAGGAVPSVAEGRQMGSDQHIGMDRWTIARAKVNCGASLVSHGSGFKLLCAGRARSCGARLQLANSQKGKLAFQ